MLVSAFRHWDRSVYLQSLGYDNICLHSLGLVSTGLQLLG